MVLLAIWVYPGAAANSKPRSVEPIDAVFETQAPGTIEASFDPPIEGVLRIVVQAGASTAQDQPKGNGGAQLAPGADQSFTLEVTQSGRSIPFHLVTQSSRHRAAVGTLIAEIDVNDLTPGMPVRIRVHSNLQNPPDLDGHAYAVVY